MMRVCDLDREPVQAVKTVRFSWDGARHQIDLCSDHLDEVESTVNSWLRGSAPSNGTRRRAGKAGGAAKAAGGSKRAPAKRSGGSNASRELRSWAKANGYNVSDRGRIPGDVRTAYEAATK
jgi:hypothetical protein